MKVEMIATGSTAKERQRGHWGLSFLVNGSLLFDTFGISSILQKNMTRQGISPSRIRHVVISHNHWDHVSGLWDILLQNRDVTVYLCPDAAEALRRKIEDFGARVEETGGPVKIEPRIYATGAIDGKYNGQRISEQALVIRSPRGLVVVTGCAHPGVVEMLERVEDQFDEDLFMLMGGLHLLDKNQDEIFDLIQELKFRGVRKIAPTHCTGDLATRLLRNAYGENFIEICEGSFVEIPDGAAP